jgi:hypothetical protein
VAEPPVYPPYPGEDEPSFRPGDPLIGFDYGGWWERTLAVIGAILPHLLILQALGAGVAIVSEATVAWLGENSAAGVVMTLVGALASVLATLAVVPLVVLTASGRPAGLGTCFRVTARRVLPLIGLSLLAGLMILVGFLLLVLPGIYLALVMTTLIPVVAVEGGWAVNRCFNLFDNRRRFALARCGTILVVMLTGSLVAVLVQGFFGGGLPGIVVGNLISAAVYAVVGPLTVTAYADMRALLEPVSTEDLARQLLS